MRGLITQLVPNHLSTQKGNKNQAPYHTLNPLLAQKNTPKIKKTHQKWRGSEKESGSEKEIGEKECGMPQEKVVRGEKEEKMRFREVYIDTNP